MVSDQSTIRITLCKSKIGSCPKVRRTLAALGLRRISQTVAQPDTAAVRGMVRTVRHLVTVEEPQP